MNCDEARATLHRLTGQTPHTPTPAEMRELAEPDAPAETRTRAALPRFPRNDGEFCYNRSGPAGAANTLRGLTRSSDLTREGLAMKATPRTCITHAGRSSEYQARASDRHYEVTGLLPGTWEWITTTCGTECLNVDHMRFKAPRKLAYPSRVCIYCGRHAGTKDHLIPRGWSGETKRKWVAIVPACGTCNSVIGSTLTWSITERRAICQTRLRRKFRRALMCIERTSDELAEFGDTLRSEIIDAMARKAEIERMLAWPETQDYDERALAKSGIEDPYALGLLIDQHEALAIAREVCYTGSGDARRFYWNQWGA